MAYKLLFLVLLAIFSSCDSTNEKKTISSWNDNLTVEQNIANNAIMFQTDNEFPFLDEIANTKTVIVLGEQDHYDLTTSEVKTNMIKYLQTKGHKYVGLESLSFMSGYLFSNPDYVETTKNWKIEHMWSPVWVKQKSCQPLISAINNKKIKVWGIDSFVNRYDIPAVKAILDKYSSTTLQIDIDWERLEDLYKRKFFHFERSGDSEQYELMRIIDSIVNYTEYLIGINKETKTDLLAIIQWVRNINTQFSGTEIEPSMDLIFSLANRNRDNQMAENIVWLTEHFPNEKLSIWCANFHGAKDISQTTYPTDSLLYLNMQTMGESVSNKLRGKLYSLAFTSLNYNNNEKGVLESEISRTTNNAPFAFIDFESLRFVDGYRDKEFDCSIIKKKQGKWSYIFDGIYYIRDQETFKD